VISARALGRRGRKVHQKQKNAVSRVLKNFWSERSEMNLADNDIEPNIRNEPTGFLIERAWRWPHQQFEGIRRYSSKSYLHSTFIGGVFYVKTE